MPRPKMTAAHRRQMREQILDQAYAILIEKGPEQISSRAIAKHLDLTHMGLFTYFPNQAAIRRALVEREQAKILDQLQVFVRRAQFEGISQVMSDALEFFQNFARENPNLFRLIWVEPEAADESRSQSHWMQPTIDLIAGLIVQGVEQGVFATSGAQLSAMMVISLVNMPFILFTSGKITCIDLRDGMAREALAAAMQYLQTAKKPGLPAGSNAWRSFTHWVRKILGSS